MTDDEAAKRIGQLEANPDNIPYWDAEVWHEAADDILCQILLEHGYPKTVEAFKALYKWYA